MTIVAIIPARGGSRRLPRKNILPIENNPIITYPIRTAIRAGLFDEVIVSTEDLEIAGIASQAGALVSERSDGLARDRSTIAEVCLDVISRLVPEPDIICCLYATAVCLSQQTLKDSFKLFSSDSEADYMMGVSEYELPPVQALCADDDGFLSYMWPEFIGIQSQFHPRLVASNGTFIWARTGSFKKEKLFYGRRLKGYVVPQAEVTDIDTPADYETVMQEFSNTPTD